MGELAKNMQDEEQTNLESEKDPSKNLDKKTAEKPEDPSMEGLSKDIIKRMENKELTPDDVVRMQDQYQKDSEAELLQMRKKEIISEKEYSEYLRKLSENKSPDKKKDIFDEIKEAPKKKAEESKLKAKKDEILPHDHKSIKEKREEVSKLLTDPETIKWIGTKNVKPFEDWSLQEINKKTSISNAENVIKELKEHKVLGIKPRKEFFERTLQPMLKKYGLNLNDTPFFKAEGLSERKDGIELAKRAEKKLEGMKNTGLYSIKALQLTMSELLKADSIGKQKEIATKVENTTVKEAELYTDMNSSILDETMSINGITMKKMSPKSKNIFLDTYKDFNLKQREESIINWKNFVEEEANMAIELGEIYKNDKEGFKNSVKTFELLDFLEKKKFLEDQRILVAEQDKETLHKSQEMVAKSVKAIDDAKEKRGVSNATAKKFKGLFLDSKNYINPQTKKIDLVKLQKAYDKLVSPKPSFDAESRNLKAYEIERASYIKMYEKFKKDNPNINGEELKKWMEKYDGETFSGRRKVFQDLVKEINDLKRKKLEAKKVEKETGITDKDKKEAKERAPERSELIVFVNDCLAEDTSDSIKDAYKALHLYKLANEDKAENDPTFLYLEETVARRKRELLTASNKNKKKSEKIAESMERVADAQNFKEKIDEASIREVNIEQTRKSQQRHHQKVSARDRAKEESIDKAGADDKKRKVINDFYKLADEKYIINTEGRETGEKINEIKFNNVKMTREQIERGRRDLRENGKIERRTKNKGFKDIKIMDDKGKELKAEEAKVKQDKLTTKLDSEMIKEAEKIAGIRRKVEKPDDSAANVQDRVAMEREARRIRQQKKEEMLRRAA